MCVDVTALPDEARRLLAAAPDEFVSERARVARELRADGRKEEAAAVAALRKPPAVVLAVNRAARDRPEAARGAADAALRVRKAQAAGAAGDVAVARREMDGALDLLAEVALAHVSPGRAAPSEAMRRRVQDLLRRAVALDGTREALRTGALREEPAAAGFDSLAGAPVPTRSGPRRGAKAAAAEKEREDRRRRRERELRSELEAAERELADAERRLRDAARARDRAERAVAALTKKLERSP